MQVVRGIKNLKGALAHPVVTIGNFDGVHIGHQEILRQAVAQAKARGGVAIAYTFRPHPQVALRPETAPALLSTYDEKAQLMAATGIDILIEEPFSREFSVITPETFFNETLLRTISAEAVVVGYDFAFGKGREGSLDILRRLCAASAINLTVVQPFKLAAEVASSSRIRQHLAQGDLASAEHLLGRPFSYTGFVKRGDGRGRTIGFPTANLETENRVLLPLGVYATWAKVDDQIFASVTNIGNRPTFVDKTPGVVIETHLLDTQIDLYGRQVQVTFKQRLRAEQKFNSVDELKSQIALDCEAARTALGKI